MFRAGGMGPMGRGGARRRTRRRWRRRELLLEEQHRAEIEKQTGRSIDQMSDEELEAEMKKRGLAGEPAETRRPFPLPCKGSAAGADGWQFVCNPFSTFWPIHVMTFR